jgi:hypothetical protein
MRIHYIELRVTFLLLAQFNRKHEIFPQPRYCYHIL